MEENSDKNVNDFGELNNLQDNAFNGEHEEGLLKEAELIAKLTQEAGFGTPEYLMGGNKNPEVANEEISQEDITDNRESLAEESVQDVAASEYKEVKLQENEQQTEIEQQTVEQSEISSELSQFEELSVDNSVFKKYIFYVSKDFVSLIDSMTPDMRTAYINDAIQRKVDQELEYSAIERKKRILTHIILMILTFFIVTPIMLFLVHKSIMVTFNNYKYSQDNFEKLYKQRFEKDRAYMRSLDYNRRHAIDDSKENNSN